MFRFHRRGVTTKLYFHSRWDRASSPLHCFWIVETSKNIEERRAGGRGRRRENLAIIYSVGRRVWGNKGGGREPESRQSTGALACGHSLLTVCRSREGAIWGLWASRRPETTGSRSQTAQSAPGAKGRRGHGERGHRAVPTWAAWVGQCPKI